MTLLFIGIPWFNCLYNYQ